MPQSLAGFRRSNLRGTMSNSPLYDDLMTVLGDGLAPHGFRRKGASFFGDAGDVLHVLPRLDPVRTSADLLAAWRSDPPRLPLPFPYERERYFGRLVAASGNGELR